MTSVVKETITPALYPFVRCYDQAPTTRRRFLQTLSLSLLAAPLAAEAQQAAKIARIGYLGGGQPARCPPPARGLPPRTA